MAAFVLVKNKYQKVQKKEIKYGEKGLFKNGGCRKSLREGL